MVTFLRHYTCGLCFLSVNLQKYVEQIYKLLFIMEFVMTELQIELAEAIDKIVSISERVKENPELGKDLTYLFLAMEPGEEGMTATLGASKNEVVQMLASLMEEDETFRECVMIVTVIVRMKSTIVGAMGGGVGGIGGLVGFMEFLKKNMDEKEEGEAKEGSEGDAETV